MRFTGMKKRLYRFSIEDGNDALKFLLNFRGFVIRLKDYEKPA